MSTLNLIGRRVPLASSIAVVLALAACGGGGGGEPSATQTSTETEATSGAVGFDDAESATVRIEALGSLVDPYEGALEGGWWGTGAILDPSGLTITNNHVVVGAATLNVQVGGEEYDARILGTSECLDLAVIDIDGDGFPYFAWHDGDIKAALEVWALGFPAVGDASYAVTRGIVSKADTANDTMWASVNHAIEHDAKIRGGNSGGPLVDESGLVVGINYAGNAEDDLNVAIHRDEVLRVYEELAGGGDVLSLGVNGSAYVGDDGSGVFVSGVASGSPADAAGIEPGDIITRMEGVTLATDGTMADYCSILRTHGTDDALAVEVYRPADGGTYVGQFNGDALELASMPEVEPGAGGGGTETDDLVVVTDDAGVLSVQVPSSWADVSSTEYEDESGNVINDMAVSPDLEGFRSSWSVSGLGLAATADGVGDFTPDDVLDVLTQDPAGGGCTIDGAREEYSDSWYTGVYEWWYGCGGLNTDYVIIAAEANDGTHLIWLMLQIAEGDAGVLEPIVGSFQAVY